MLGLLISFIIAMIYCRDPNLRNFESRRPSKIEERKESRVSRVVKNHQCLPIYFIYIFYNSAFSILSPVHSSLATL